jgi:hypothetical protein
MFTNQARIACAFYVRAMQLLQVDESAEYEKKFVDWQGLTNDEQLAACLNEELGLASNGKLRVEQSRGSRGQFIVLSEDTQDTSYPRQFNIHTFAIKREAYGEDSVYK